MGRADSRFPPGFAASFVISGGGIVGRVSSGTLTVIGSFTATACTAFVGYACSGTAVTAYNCYYDAGKCAAGIGAAEDTAVMSTEGATGADGDDFASGRICYLLNQGGAFYYQTLGEDSCPVLDAGSDTVSYDADLDKYYNVGTSLTYTGLTYAVQASAAQTDQFQISIPSTIAVGSSSTAEYTITAGTLEEGQYVIIDAAEEGVLTTGAGDTLSFTNSLSGSSLTDSDQAITGTVTVIVDDSAAVGDYTGTLDFVVHLYTDK